MTDRPIFSTSPLITPVISLMAGIIYGRFFNAPSYLLPLVSVILLIGFLSAIKGRRHSLLAISALIFFITGSIHIQKISFPDDPADIYNLITKPTEITLVATIRSVSIDIRKHGRILVTVHEILKRNGFQTNTRGLLQLKTDFIPAKAFEPGQKIIARADVYRIRKNSTPGTFDYRQYMADRNIYVSGKIRSSAAMNILISDNTPQTIFDRSSLFFQRSRNSVSRFIMNSDLDNSTKGLYAAIITGQRNSIPEYVLEDFRRSGAFHLLAISGMHMFLLFLLTTLILNLLLKNSMHILLRFPIWKLSAAFALIPLIYYTAISGANPPSVRAFIMTTVLIIAIIADRQNSIFNTLCLAAFIILILDPTALFSPSFQLSFAAVSGIIIFNNSFSLGHEHGTIQVSKFQAFKKWIQSALIVSLIALAVTSPLTLYYFQQTSFMGPFSTILCAPAICFFSLPLGLLASLIHQIFPTAASFLLQTGALGLVFAENVTSFLASIPYVWMKHSPPTIFQIIFFYIFLFSMLKISRSRRSWLTPAFFLLLTALSPATSNSFTAHTGQVRVSFIDVGQGNATLLELPDGINVLIDGGAIRSGDFDVGERIIAPFLWHRKIRKLDMIIITHAHSDHYNGLETIIDFFRPKKIWVNGSTSEDPGYNKILAQAKRSGATIIIPDDGEYLVTGKNASLRCLNNFNLHQSENSSENSRSLVVEITSHERSIILPGDLMRGDGEKILKGQTRNTDILLAPHHGSKSSATNELVKLLKPDHLVVASGSFRKEAEDSTLVQELEMNTMRLYKINKIGTTSCTIRPDGLIFETLSDRGQEYEHTL